MPGLTEITVTSVLMKHSSCFCSSCSCGYCFLPARWHSKLCKCWYSQSRDVRLSVRLSVCLSVTLRYCIKTKKASVMISSPSESLNVLVSRNIWIIMKFERGHPERGRFMRLGWVKIGNFEDFSTNKPPYLRNGVR